MFFYERLTGARMHASYYRLGGVFSDLPDQFLNDLSLFITKFSYRLDELDDLLSSNVI